MAFMLYHSKVFAVVIHLNCLTAICFNCHLALLKSKVNIQDNSGWAYIHIGYDVTNIVIYLELEIRSMERGICPIATLALRLTLYSLTGSRV